MNNVIISQALNDFLLKYDYVTLYLNFSKKKVILNSMTLDEKLYIKTRFELMVHKLNGKSFQDFFVQIMVANNSGFTPVKPYGSIGDRSNDGFIPSTGTYFQVYAPENPANSIATAIAKLHHDFNGLHSYWNGATPIKEFVFVVNDKYLGVGPQLHPELKKIEAAFPQIKCKEFFAQHLEEITLNLPEDKIYHIIGFIPDPIKIDQFDSGVMNEVVGKLLENYHSFVPSFVSKNPNFEPKIRFNKLSEYPATLLRCASWQSGSLDDYFKKSVTQKEKVRQIFSNIYVNAEGKVKANASNRSDLIFDLILQESHPQVLKRKEINDVVLVLMAYYFELCDIFKEPPISVQQTLPF